MANASQLEFGLKDATIAAPAIWGARAYIESRTTEGPPRREEDEETGRMVTVRDVIHHHDLVLLPNRQHLIGDDEDMRHVLRNALNGGVLDTYRKFVEQIRRDNYNSEGKWSDFRSAGVCIRTLSRGGYLYITATWEGH